MMTESPTRIGSVALMRYVDYYRTTKSCTNANKSSIDKTLSLNMINYIFRQSEITVKAIFQNK